jgi:hypothetical protein
MSAGGLVDLTVTFLSPVVPDDLLRASLPYTYLNLEVKSADGGQHNVQLYTDISAEWVSGDHGATAQWNYGTIKEGYQPHPWGPAPRPSWPASHVRHITRSYASAID